MPFSDPVADETVPCLQPRAPRQARGQRRVDGILDAAESLIAEVGLAQGSIQEIARRAGASVGSIYHFFPTKDALLAALAERYAERLREVAACMSGGAVACAAGAVGDFVAALVDPFADFIARHPAYLVLSRAEGSGRGGVSNGMGVFGRDVRQGLAVALAARFPAVTPEDAAFRAAMVEALGEGVLSLMARSPNVERPRLVAEFRRALGAYLGSHDDVTIPVASA